MNEIQLLKYYFPNAGGSIIKNVFQSNCTNEKVKVVFYARVVDEMLIVNFQN